MKLAKENISQLPNARVLCIKLRFNLEVFFNRTEERDDEHLY